MDNDRNLDKQYWDGVISNFDREDSNADRRYRRHNQSLEAMGDKLVGREQIQLLTDIQVKAFEAIFTFVDNINDENLLRAIRKLKPIDLQILIMRFEQKMQVQEIAKRTGKGVSTVSERLKRILCRLIEDIERSRANPDIANKSF